jgi:glycosyltransferase involved in cell wall biosynthesis
MLIVDDGSKDRTVEIAQSFADSDKRIKVFARENIGVFRMKENYNFALERTKGKYIAILDGDDVWLPKKLELQTPLLENNNKAVVVFGQSLRASSDLTKNISLDPNKRFHFLYKKNTEDIEIEDISQQIILGNFVPALTILMRKSALESIGGFVQSHNLPLVDLPTLLELSLLGTFIFVQKPLGKWRHHGNQITLIHTLTLQEQLRDFSYDFYKKHKNNPKFANINKQKIYNSFNKYGSIRYSRSGRYKLSKKDYRGAKRDYLKSIFKFGFHEPVWKLRSLAGLFCAIFHIDLEKIVKKLGRPTYS